MASNKNQHFVPRCYLKPFTLNGDNVAINLLNIDRLRCIESAPVKNQCSRDYFYGKDLLLEQALQCIEGAYARGLSRMLRPGYSLDDSDRELLRRFLFLQHLRTEASSRRTVEMAAGVQHTIGASSDFDRITTREAIHLAMATFASEKELLDDLKVCLVRNRTNRPFVTSDDPAVLTNRWYMEDRRTIGRSPGLHSAGALLLLPLSPQVLCLAYDGDVYTIAHSGGWVDVRRERDIQAYNEHQYLNCRANIYFCEWDQHQQILEDFNAIASLRLSKRHRIHYAVFDQTSDGHDRYRVVDRTRAAHDEDGIVHVEVVLPKPTRWPLQVSWRRGGAAYTNGTGIGYVRRGAIARLNASGLRKVKTR